MTGGIQQDEQLPANEGGTENFSGTLNTTAIQIPSSADKIISGFLIVADGSNIEFSDDGGSTWFPLERRERISWDAKGLIKQISLRTSSGTADYRAKINFSTEE